MPIIQDIHSPLNELPFCLCPWPTESPLQFYVNYPNSGSVSAYGPGLVYGVANKTATFTIVTEDAGEGTVWFP